MRLPRFRAWDTENNCWFVPTYKASEGKLEDLMLSMQGRLLLRTTTGLKDESIFPNRFELMEFTGLMDKNGVDIYEGDIVQNAKRKGKKSTPVMVEWDAQFAGFWPFYDTEQPYDLDCAVISNIYQDKELLL